LRISAAKVLKAVELVLDCEAQFLAMQVPPKDGTASPKTSAEDLALDTDFRSVTESKASLMTEFAAVRGFD
jgi:hypothetical protein